MQYDGFISSLIERSETLLTQGANDDLNVTRYLLVMNTGFALVRDRIRYWDNKDDRRVRQNPWGKIKAAGKMRLSRPVDVDGETFFEEFRKCGDWAYFRVSDESRRVPLSALDVVRSLVHAREVPIERLKLDSVIWPLRNSLAHGGIIPMSPHQASELYRNQGSLSLVNESDFEIDRVYFVSDWTGDSGKDVLGRIVLKFGLVAMEAFWKDWRKLVLASGDNALLDLDIAV